MGGVPFHISTSVARPLSEWPGSMVFLSGSVAARRFNPDSSSSLMSRSAPDAQSTHAPLPLVSTFVSINNWAGPLHHPPQPAEDRRHGRHEAAMHRAARRRLEGHKSTCHVQNAKGKFRKPCNLGEIFGE